MARKNPLFAARIAALGIGHQELAAAAQIHRTSVSRILNLRQVPSPATAARIAAALDSTPTALGLAAPERGCE